MYGGYSVSWHKDLNKLAEERGRGDAERRKTQPGQSERGLGLLTHSVLPLKFTGTFG